MLEQCDFPTINEEVANQVVNLQNQNQYAIAKMITLAEYLSDKRIATNVGELAPGLETILEKVKEAEKAVPVLGITGTGGAGKSSLIDELVLRFLSEFPEKKLAILSVDPT